jgi:hypothetical protein
MSSPEQRIEQALEDLYVPMYRSLIGMSLAEARSNFKEELAFIKGIIAKRGEFVVSEGYGSFLINNRRSDPKIGAEGVREADILWFWNMSNVERLFLTRTSEFIFMSSFLALCRQGLTSDQARARCRQLNPIFGDPDDASIASGVDRPLPVELKDRINIFIENRHREDSPKFRALMDRSSSFNAIVRMAIKNGSV